MNRAVKSTCLAVLLLAAATVHARPLRVVATTPLVGDTVRQVAGERVDLRVLLPPGVDPHAFQPTPRDAALLADADVIFANGLGLEDGFLPSLLDRRDIRARTVEVSQGIEPRELGAIGHDAEEGRHEHRHGESDPHVWFNPQHVKTWARNVARALQDLDPDGADAYASGAAAYGKTLDDLDAWARGELERIPVARRKLVTDHEAYGYFAEHYGFELVGAILPGFSSGAEPSARDLARLEDAIRRVGVSAVFVGTVVNPDLAARVARDTGVRLVYLDTCSLAEGADYAAFLRGNVNRIVEALR
jgi:ABC-type Zn uptake system ZnuABC Zn-binding protein ZnuA